MRIGQVGRGHRGGGGGLIVPDEVLRPACEATIEIARVAASAHPPVPPAGPLRPLLRMRRLPDRALHTVRKVLDEDDLLRSAVAAATTEELVGRPSWLYLQRPDGWEDELAGVVAAQEDASASASEARTHAATARRLAAVEESLRRVGAELTAARAEAAAAKERLADERRARRLADTDAGRLRRQVADLEVASSSTDERDRLAAEVDLLRARLADVAAPPAPTGPDRGALRRALARLDAARDELTALLVDEPAPLSSRPSAAPRRRPADLPPAVFEDTVEAAEHLVRLAGVLVLVDGYNVTKRTWPDATLPDQRRWLIDAVTGLAARAGAEVQVVFDGAEDVPSAPAHGPRRVGVHVRYTEADVEADDDLIALVAGAPLARPVVVVSDDRRVRTGAAGLGANLVGSGTFADLLRR